MNSAIFLASLLFSSLLNTSLSADPHYPQNCVPKTCGILTNVTFPFFLRDLQPDYCGLPAFEINCHGNTPKLSMPEEDYNVLSISYKNRTLAVSMAKFDSPDRRCLLPYHNISFSLTPFAISSLNRELVFTYNCSAIRDGFVEIDCHGNRTYAYLGGKYQIGEKDGIPGECFTAVMPVMNPAAGDLAGKYAEILAGGFLLNWTAPDCSECLRSDGQCGYNNETRNFMCICPDRAHWKSCTEGGSSKSSLQIGLTAAGGVIGFIVLCLLVGLLLYRRRRKYQFSRWKFSGKGSHSFELSNGENEGGSSLLSTIFSYEELYQATNGFHASQELGDGGFGTVYKGKLKDGRAVAVKRLYENNYRRQEQFMNEVKILSLLRHPNLVTLYGCTSPRSRELLLVYEFVPNGTVADHLHGPKSSLPFLPWPARLAIAIQTADALCYLHSVEPPIIHRDVKTTNILLDQRFHVKVADFGLSRLFPPDATHVSTAPQGTPGYLDPEYHQFYQLTDKSDVYSFGVVLMELISSMPAVDIGRGRSEVNLASLAAGKIRRREMTEFVDRRLGFESNYGVTGMINEVAALGLRCLEAEGEARPGIKEVAEILRGVETMGRKADEVAAAAVMEAKEETRLMDSVGSFSPSSVTERWPSKSSSMASFITITN